MEISLSDAIIKSLSCKENEWGDIKKVKNGSKEYDALAFLFSGLHQGPSEDLIRACSCAIYSWIPSMLRSVDVEKIKSALDGNSSTPIEPFFDGHQTWSATSKFLHFYDPIKYSIWDSRVKKAIQRKYKKFTVNSSESYKNYCGAINKIASDKTFADEDWFKDIHPLTKNNNSRVIELALYVVGGK